MTEYVFYDSKLYKALCTGRGQRHKKGYLIQSTDYREALTIVSKGFVKRYSITNAGNASIQSIYGPGDVFPLTWVFKNLLGLEIYTGNETYYYETLTEATIFTISKNVLEELIANDPSVYKDLLYIAGIRLRSNIQILENSSLENTEKRLAHLLLYYAKYNGEKMSEGARILIPLKHEDLASVLDTRRETISINLKSLRQRKLVTVDTYIIVSSLADLEEFAYS